LVPGGGYKSLKLLHLTSPYLPLLTFSEGAMPELQRIDLQFTTLEGLGNMESLASLLLGGGGGCQGIKKLSSMLGETELPNIC
jgi:hypothetical protein